MTLNLAAHYRHKHSKKYPLRFVQGDGFRKLNRKERRNRKGHKYEILRRLIVQTDIVGITIDHEFFRVTPDGLVEFFPGYRSDGPSGPTVDTASFMRGAFTHDVWFQVLRELEKLIASGEMTLSPEWPTDIALLWRRIFDAANEGLRKDCKTDGMLWPRYHWVYYAVHKAGASSAGGVR